MKKKPEPSPDKQGGDDSPDLKKEANAEIDS